MVLMEQALISAGLTPQQARAYLYIIDNFPSSPATIAAYLRLSRTNAYKLADKLVEMGLVNKEIINKKVAYIPNDPVALSGLVAEARNKMVALEKATKEAMRIIQSRKSAKDPTEAKVYQGRLALIELYKEQADRGAEVRSIHTRADIPIMGFTTMNQIRHLWSGKKGQRYGFTPDAPGAVNNPALDTHTNLHRTWLPRDSYTAPVEWSTCEDGLILYIYASEPYAIKISDKHVADAFRQLWQIMDYTMRQSRNYKDLPRYADRVI
jgi:predicted transcriptional regulator